MKQRTSIIGLTISGLVVILIYLGAATGIIQNVNQLILILLFAFGLVGIALVIEIHRHLATDNNSLILKAGTVFLIIGFVLFSNS